MDVYTESTQLVQVGAELANLPEVHNLYEVTGSADLRALIRVESLPAFRKLLVNRILKIQGVKTTTSAIILQVCKERG
jgi:DNA-binding Lrp family transcriptional regulator